MKQEKAYEMITGLVDNELSSKKRLQILQQIQSDHWCNKEYVKLKKLKESLSTLPPPLSLSPNFDANLMTKINEQKYKEPILSRFMNFGMMNRVAYSVATASIIFMGFLGVEYFHNPGTDNLQVNPSLSTLASSPVSSSVSARSSQRNKSLANLPVSTDMAIIGANGELKVYKGEEFMSINLHSDNPLAKVDHETQKHFGDMLSYLEYYRGMYFKEIGNHKKSRDCFEAFVSTSPNSRLTHHIQQNELNQSQTVTLTPDSNEK